PPGHHAGRRRTDGLDVDRRDRRIDPEWHRLRFQRWEHDHDQPAAPARPRQPRPPDPLAVAGPGGPPRQPCFVQVPQPTGQKPLSLALMFTDGLDAPRSPSMKSDSSLPKPLSRAHRQLDPPGAVHVPDAMSVPTK